MSMTFVVNEPVCMSTGRPPRVCNCGGHARNLRQLLNAAKNGEVSEIELGKLLGVQADPKVSPTQFAAELKSKLDELLARFGGEAAAMPDQEDEADAMATTAMIDEGGNPDWSKPAKKKRPQIATNLVVNDAEIDAETVRMMTAGDDWQAIVNEDRRQRRLDNRKPAPKELRANDSADRDDEDPVVAMMMAGERM